MALDICDWQAIFMSEEMPWLVRYEAGGGPKSEVLQTVSNDK